MKTHKNRIDAMQTLGQAHQEIRRILDQHDITITGYPDGRVSLIALYEEANRTWKEQLVLSKQEVSSGG